MVALFAEAAIVAEQTIGAIVRDSVLGGVAIGGVAIGVWALRVMKRCLELRVADAETYAAKLEASNEKDRAHGESLKDMLRSVLGALKDVSTSIDNQTRVAETQNRVIEGLSSAMNGVLREAIGMRRAAGSGSHRAVDELPRPPTRSGEGPGRYGKGGE